VTANGRIRNFLSGLPGFAHEMRDFPRRARYTVAARGLRALLSDIRAELSTRLRRGSLAQPDALHPADWAVDLPQALRVEPRPNLELPEVESPIVSIVIPAFNEFEHTYGCVASVVERTAGVAYEIIVVDDASEDETRRAEAVLRGARILHNATNAGFIESCNRGAAAARGTFVVFLNNDTFVTVGWLDAILAAFGEKDVGLVGAKLIYPDGRLQEAGGIIFSDASGWNYGRGDDPANPKYGFRCDAHYCSGACIAVRSSAFRDLGGFDTRFAPMYYEDVDLAFAIRESGQRVVYEPSCVIVHAEGGTAGTDTGQGAKRYQVVNQQKFAQKWAHVLGSQPSPDSNPDVARYRDSGPHVLVIDSYTPRPDRDAGSVRMVNLMRLLRQMGCRVSFMPENRAQFGDYTRALQSLGIETLYHPFLPTLEDHLRRFGARYRTVLVSRVDVAEALLEPVRQHCPQAQIVFDTVDLHFLREARRAALPGAKADRTERIKQREIGVAERCDVTLVVSPVERDLLAREAPDCNVEVLSLIQSVDPTDTPFSDRQGIVFIANFQHPPNADALEHYLREVHPSVSDRLPGSVLTVIGDRVPDSARKLAADTATKGSNVHFAGYVEDIRSAFAAARVSVAPLRFGAGIKGKINTSLAFRVPVVTTAVGAEGMDLRHGEHVLIADEPSDFADAVVQLYSDPELWERLAESGLTSVASQFSFERAQRTLEAILRP
jgi:GT2 family glycosyltransferase/glycosyltransferase involved in cell wall biosynthesis